MSITIAVLFGIAVFLSFPRRLQAQSTKISEPVFADVPLFQLIESLRMCLQSGLSTTAAFKVLDQCSIQAKLIHQAKSNIAVGLPVLHSLDARDNDYATEILISLLERSSLTGGAIDKSLLILAQQLRSDAHDHRLQRIRAVAVKSVLPLGICFLPAFVLVGVVPIVMSFGKSVIN